MAENGNDIEAEKAKVAAAEADRDKYKDQLETATTELEKFKDVDPEEFKTTVENLKAELKAKDEKYAAEEADRLFKDSFACLNIKKLVRILWKTGGKIKKAFCFRNTQVKLRETENNHRKPQTNRSCRLEFVYSLRNVL